MEGSSKPLDRVLEGRSRSHRAKPQLVRFCIPPPQKGEHAGQGV